MSQGIGQLRVARGDITIAVWMIHEGSGLVADLNGAQFEFVLERAPLPSEFDIRKMSAIQLAEMLARRLRDEEEDRRQDALEAESWDD